MIHFPSAHQPAPASQEKGTRTPSPQTRKRHAKRKCTPQKRFLLLLECTIHQQNTFIKQYVTGKTVHKSVLHQVNRAQRKSGRAATDGNIRSRNLPARSRNRKDGLPSPPLFYSAGSNRRVFPRVSPLAL